MSLNCAGSATECVRGLLDALHVVGVGYNHVITSDASFRQFCNHAEEDPLGSGGGNTQRIGAEDSAIGPVRRPFNFYYLITAEATCSGGGTSANGPFGFADKNRNGVNDPGEARPSGLVLDVACQP